MAYPSDRAINIGDGLLVAEKKKKWWGRIVRKQQNLDMLLLDW